MPVNNKSPEVRKLARKIVQTRAMRIHRTPWWKTCWLSDDALRQLLNRPVDDASLLHDEQG
jgi:hypothetical protein